jgi:hypothetical protein
MHVVLLPVFLPIPPLVGHSPQSSLAHGLYSLLSDWVTDCLKMVVISVALGTALCSLLRANIEQRLVYPFNERKLTAGVLTQWQKLAVADLDN